MPASVAFKFAPPDQENLVKLHILEAVAALGPYDEIDVVESVGTYPDYIDNYTTANATSASNWFSLQWEDDKGALSEMSAPLKGGEDTLVSQVVDRARQRDRTLDLRVLTQEAEAVIEGYYGEDVDVYSVDLAVGVPYRVLNGLVYLAMARVYISTSLMEGGAVTSATLGLVSFRTESGNTREVDVGALIDLANTGLGLNTSIVLQMESIFTCQQWWNVLEQ